MDSREERSEAEGWLVGEAGYWRLRTNKPQRESRAHVRAQRSLVDDVRVPRALQRIPKRYVHAVDYVSDVWLRALSQGGKAFVCLLLIPGARQRSSGQTGLRGLSTCHTYCH
jgi:hypothetical protein